MRAWSLCLAECQGSDAQYNVWLDVSQQQELGSSDVEKVSGRPVLGTELSDSSCESRGDSEVRTRLFSKTFLVLTRGVTCKDELDDAVLYTIIFRVRFR